MFLNNLEYIIDGWKYFLCLNKIYLHYIWYPLNKTVNTFLPHFNHSPSFFVFSTFDWLFLNQLLSIKPNFIASYNLTHTPCSLFKFGKISDTVFTVLFGNLGYPTWDTSFVSFECSWTIISFVLLERKSCLSFYFTLSTPRIVFDNNPSPSIFTCEVSVNGCIGL